MNDAITAFVAASGWRHPEELTTLRQEGNYLILAPRADPAELRHVGTVADDLSVLWDGEGCP